MGDTFEGVPNYTGPNISDGKFQTSVEFGSAVPKDDLDVLSRLHDSAYAKWNDFNHRTAADAWYSKEAKKLGQTQADLAANAVLYGNFTMRSLSSYGIDITNFTDAIPDLITRVVEGGVLSLMTGLVKPAVTNMYNLNSYMVNEDKLRKDLLNYFKTDPHIELQEKKTKQLMATAKENGLGVLRSDESTNRTTIPKNQIYFPDASPIQSNQNSYFPQFYKTKKKKKNRMYK